MPLKFRTIRQRITFDSPPAEVYSALLDAKKHAEFTGSPSTANAEIGVAFSNWDGYVSGKNLELLKDKKIVQEWLTSEWPPGYPPSRLELTFKKTQKGTLLTMVHSRVPAAQADDYAQGWHDSYWNPMKEFFKRKKA